MAIDINQIIEGTKRDAAGFIEIRCERETFLVAAGLNRGSCPRESKGPHRSLEVAFRGGKDYLATYESIYEPVRRRMARDSLTALYVPVQVVNDMIAFYGGLAMV